MISFCFADPREGIASLERALAIDPHHALTRSSLGTARLALGDLGRSSWADYHWRLRVPDYRQPPEPVRHLPEWDGSPITGRLLLWMEQGLGDWLFSLRFVDRIVLPPQQVVIATDPRLQSLVQRSLPACQLVAEDALDPAHLGITHIFPLCSLGMEADLEGVMEGRWPTPYLQPDPVKVESFRSALAAKGPGLRVGISWSSDPQRSHGRDKSVPLRLFRQLAEVEGVQLVDLQYGDTEAERRAFAALAGRELLSLPFDKREDLESLAALIQACDLVVTVSNVTAHLAGALGVPGFVLLPAAKGLFWYWHRERSDSPWYPSLTLVRQQRPGEWEEAVKRVSDQVARICHDRFGSDQPPSRTPLAADLPTGKVTAAPIGHPTLLRWLERTNSVRPEITRLPADLLPPYAAALVGDEETAIQHLTSLLEQQPGRLDAAFLLGGVHVLRGRGNVLHVEKPQDPAQNQRLNSATLAALNRLALPLLSLSPAISEAGCSINAAELLRFFATHAFKVGDGDLAVRCLSQAVDYQPTDPQLYIHLFNVLDGKGRRSAAYGWLLKGLELWPDNLDLFRTLRGACTSQGRWEETLFWARKAYLKDRRNFPDALYYLCSMPVVAKSVEESARHKQRFIRNLRRMKVREFNDPRLFRGGVSVPSFLVAYQNSDMKPIQELQASVFYRAYSSFFEGARISGGETAGKTAGRRSKIAFISPNFHSSSNCRAFEGLIRNLDRDLFDVLLLHAADAKRDKHRDRLDKCVREAIVLPENLEEAAAVIQRLNLDIIFYTDIGVHAQLYLLAMLRLARIQVTGWGIPHTSGLKSIDYYISTMLAEPRGAHRHYTESLHMVSRLPCCYLKEQLPPNRGHGRDYFFLPRDAFIFACLQQLHKLHPDFDPILEEIAKRHSNAVFVFSAGDQPALTELLQQRWGHTAPTLLRKVQLLAPMSRSEFVSLCSCVDLLLDPPYYGSGITFYESAHTGTPTISLKGRFLRSRFVAGAYRMLNIKDAPVATTASGFVDLCTALAIDEERLLELRTKLARNAEENLYEDFRYVREVESFLLSALDR
jgi:predicted O-linked N-acetylglucosamine transferase (SPINDLY family)